MAESQIKSADILQYFDAHLRNRNYISGGRFSMGDIPMGCAIWRWMSLPIERPVLANIERWFDLLRGRAAYQKVVMLPIS